MIMVRVQCEMQACGSGVKRCSLFRTSHRWRGYAAKLRLRGGVEVPEFDPLDGGVDAQVLFLFEKPVR